MSVKALIYQSLGADPGFFLGGGALVSCSTSTPINHMFFFFCRILCCIRKPQVISGGEGAHTLHPPPRSAPGLCQHSNPVSRLYPITVTSIVVNSMTPNINPTSNDKINRSGLVQFRSYLVWKRPVVYMKKMLFSIPFQITSFSQSFYIFIICVARPPDKILRILASGNSIQFAIIFRWYHCSILKVEREALQVITALLKTVYDVTNLVSRPQVTKETVIYIIKCCLKNSYRDNKNCTC